MAARKKPGARIFEALKSGALEPLYAIDGDERLLVDEAVVALKAAAVPANAADFNFDAMNGKEVSVARIIDAAQTLPAFAARRMVLVTQAEHIDAEQALPLLTYFEDPCPSTVLALVASSKFDARTKFYKTLQKVNATFRFERPTPREMPAALTARARSMGLQVQDAAIRLLVDAVGTDLSAAAQALEVVALYVGPKTPRPITEDDVAALVSVTRQENIFQLVDAIGAKDRATVMEGLHTMLSGAQAHPLQILALVARHYRILMKAKAAVGTGVARADLQRVLGVPPFAVDKVLRQSRGYSGRRLSENLSAVAAADRALKGGRLDPARAMERLVFDLMSPGVE